MIKLDRNRQTRIYMFRYWLQFNQMFSCREIAIFRQRRIMALISMVKQQVSTSSISDLRILFSWCRLIQVLYCRGLHTTDSCMPQVWRGMARLGMLVWRLLCCKNRTIGDHLAPDPYSDPVISKIYSNQKIFRCRVEKFTRISSLKVWVKKFFLSTMIMLI